MPSKDSKTGEKNDGAVVKFTTKNKKPTGNGKKKKGISPAQIVTYVILALLAIVLIAGVFPTFGMQGGSQSLVFGTYDGIPIEFANGNYFYRQYQNQARQITDRSDYGMFQIWRGAYESTVFHTAVTRMAEKAGIRVTDETLSKAIRESGIYDKDGTFDVATYEQASAESKTQVRIQYEETLPVRMVLEDIATVLTHPAEIDYIIRMSDSARTFEYVVFDASRYPDELARQYAQNNLSRFTLIDLSMITFADRDEAESVREQIVSGSLSFADAAKNYSKDGFASEGGRAGIWYLHELENNFVNKEEVNILFSTKAGDITRIFETPSGFALYQVEATPFLPDLNDPETLADVKSYLSAYEQEMVTTYLEHIAEEFARSASQPDNWEASVQEASLSVTTVGATPVNIGNSSYLNSFSQTDPKGYLATVSQDTTIMRMLYTEQIGSITDPFLANNAYVVARITGEKPLDDQTKDYIRLVYPYYAQSQSQQDLIQAIFNSDKFEDNFLTVFMEQVMGISLSTS